MFGLMTAVGALSLLMATLASGSLEHLSMLGAAVLLVESLVIGSATLLLVLLASGYMWLQVGLLIVASLVMYASYKFLNMAEREGWLWNN